ncbi:tetratricopeptide repeat protein [Acinetobacter calcoaceticus]
MKNSKTINSITHSILIMGAVISCVGVLSISSASAQDQLNAEYKPGNIIYDKWDRFYKIEQSQPAEAEKILIELSKLTPTDIKVWKSLTYLQIRLEKREEALQSLKQARNLAPQDDTLKLQEAYLLNQQKKNREALVLFKELTSSSDPAIADKANQAVKNLSGGEVKTYFRDVYFAPSYESRYDDVIFPLKARYGKNFDNGRAQVYGFLNLNRDTQSQGGVRPEIIDENAVTLGIGANYQPWTSIPVRAYLEVGGSYDLIDRNRDKFRESVIGGVTGYQEWYSQNNCNHSLCFNDYFTDLYGNAATYSREDYNVIGDLRLRTGLNVYKGENGTVQAYVKLHGLADSKDEYYNNLFEYGPGISWQPFNYQPIKLRVERLYGNYFKDVPIDTKDHYNNTRVELVFYKDF